MLVCYEEKGLCLINFFLAMHILCADVQFLPISGLYGHNMKERMSKSVCPWWDGPCLFEALDAVELPERNPAGPFRYFEFFVTLICSSIWKQN